MLWSVGLGVARLCMCVPIGPYLGCRLHLDCMLSWLHDSRARAIAARVCLYSNRSTPIERADEEKVRGVIALCTLLGP